MNKVIVNNLNLFRAREMVDRFSVFLVIDSDLDFVQFVENVELGQSDARVTVDLKNQIKSILCLLTKVICKAYCQVKLMKKIS
jgi:hypothetical protein